MWYTSSLFWCIFGHSQCTVTVEYSNLHWHNNEHLFGKILPTDSRQTVLLYCNNYIGTLMTLFFLKIILCQNVAIQWLLLWNSPRLIFLTPSHDENGRHKGGAAQARAPGADQARLPYSLLLFHHLIGHEDLTILQHAGLWSAPQQGESQVHFKEHKHTWLIKLV